ncbi:hypothetical protein RHGRI_029443 [Rhododendron griersonianum]|uniref:Uncharacterized protein n=1 Tax=Rhododendron griersonianum TaxID=479676 RepID=A0AAV6IPW0_9ERIC|nr:hypothetical protein RHGRI_029443 [Rhododendron griersonianum]
MLGGDRLKNHFPHIVSVTSDSVVLQLHHQFRLNSTPPVPTSNCPPPFRTRAMEPVIPCAVRKTHELGALGSQQLWVISMGMDITHGWHLCFRMGKREVDNWNSCTQVSTLKLTGNPPLMLQPSPHMLLQLKRRLHPKEKSKRSSPYASAIEIATS